MRFLLAGPGGLGTKWVPKRRWHDSLPDQILHRAEVADLYQDAMRIGIRSDPTRRAHIFVPTSEAGIVVRLMRFFRGARFVQANGTEIASPLPKPTQPPRELVPKAATEPRPTSSGWAKPIYDELAPIDPWVAKGWTKKPAPPKLTPQEVARLGAASFAARLAEAAAYPFPTQGATPEGYARFRIRDMERQADPQWMEKALDKVPHIREARLEREREEKLESLWHYHRDK